MLKYLKKLNRRKKIFLRSLKNGKFERQSIYDEAHNLFYADKDYTKASQMYQEYVRRLKFSIKSLKAYFYIGICYLNRKRVQHV